MAGTRSQYGESHQNGDKFGHYPHGRVYLPSLGGLSGLAHQPTKKNIYVFSFKYSNI